MIIQVCIGSSCHLRGSTAVVERMRHAIAEHRLEEEVTLAASFCIGKCNPNGVTVQVDDDIHVGINTDNVAEFFQDHVLRQLGRM